MSKMSKLFKVKRDDNLPFLSIGLPKKAEPLPQLEIFTREHKMEAEKPRMKFFKRENKNKFFKEKKQKEKKLKEKIKSNGWNDKELQPANELPYSLRSKQDNESEILDLERIIDDTDFIDTLKKESSQKPSKYVWKTKLLRMNSAEADVLRKQVDEVFRKDVSNDTSLFEDIDEKRQILKYVDAFIYSYYASWKLEAFGNMKVRLELREKLKKEAPRLKGFPNAVLDELLEESVGLGVIERIIRNETVSDIGFNGTQLVVESNDQKEVNQTGGFVDGNYIHRLIVNFASTIGKDFNSTNPILDVVYGSLRVNAVHESASNGSPTISIRVSHPGIMVNDAIVESMSNKAMSKLMSAFVKAKCNIVVCGETGSGKTEFTKHLISTIPFVEKIVLIEDVAEMHAKQIFPNADIISWLVTPSASASDQLKASLRNGPTWVVVVEVRSGSEANEWLQAIRSDHKSITSIHASSAMSIPNRLMGMIGEVRNVQEDRIEDEIKSLLNIGIHINVKWVNGRKQRYIADIVEFRGKKEGDSILLFEQEMDSDGKTSSKMKTISEEMHKRLSLAGADLTEYDSLVEEYEKENLTPEEIAEQKRKERIKGWQEIII